MTPDFEDLDLRPAPPKPADAPPVDLGVSLPRSGRRRRSPRPRAILFAGVAGACVLGVGLGLWARPAMHERRVAVAAPEPEAPPVDPNARHLQIVVNDGPAAPVGAPIETLRPASSPMFTTLRPRQDGHAVMGAVPELTRLEPKPLQMPHLEVPHIDGPKLPDLAPMMAAAAAASGHWLANLKPAEHPPAEVARAETARPAIRPATQARRLQLAEADRAAKAAEAQAARDAAREAQAEAAQQAAVEKAEAHRLALAQAAKAQQAKLEQARQARAERIEQARIEQARLDQARAEKAKLQRAKLEKAKADKAEKLRLAKVQKAEAQKLAQAEAKGRAEAREEAKAMVLAQAREEAKKRERLEALVHAVQKVLPHAQPQPVETARLDRKHAAKARRQEPVVERASLKAKRAPHAVEPAARSHPVQLAPADPSGLVKVSTPRCASHDPGAAMVCADPNLTAADRQMARAYQGARAAGVPEAQLQAQQQRWLAARSAAAREAPWAMRDVYLARIAELNGQAREAHTDGY